MASEAERMGSAEPTLELLALAEGELQRRLQLVGPEDWARTTPCTEWDVRALVNHVVGANVRYEMLLRGAPADEVHVAVHAWDLAQALGADDELDAELVAFALAQAPTMVAPPGQRSFATPIAGDGDRSPQEQLLRLLGRQPRRMETT